MIIRRNRNTNDMNHSSGAFYNLLRLGLQLLTFAFLAHVMGCFLFAVSENYPLNVDKVNWISPF